MRQLKITKQVTNRETKSLINYLSDVSKIDLITADEEVELAQRIQEGDEVALKKLTNANLRFVISVAKQYQNQGLSLSDLINEGNLGLIKAARRFDETRGFKFISYAVWWIRQSILGAISEHSRTVRIPLNKIGQLNKINKAKGRLAQIYERPPSSAELAKELDLSIAAVKSTMRSTGKSFSMDAPLGNETNDFSMHNILESDTIGRPDKKLMNESLETEIDRALSTLPNRESDILKMNFGLEGNKPISLSEIGEMYNLSRERVRQIKEKALRQLKHKSKSQVLMTYLG